MPIASESNITYEMANGLLLYDCLEGILYYRFGMKRIRGHAIGLYGEVREAGRVIWLLHYGEWPPLDKLVDHKDRNRQNWKIDNLRLATYPQNAFNMASRNDYAKGVTFDGHRKKCWRAQIRINGRKVNLGRFENIDEAKEAYKQAALEHHGEFVCLE